MVNVLVLCTGNSCRSIMTEALLKKYSEGKLQAFSAGSFPTGKVHPLSLFTLEKNGIDAHESRSKSWDEFKETSIDILITVCDNAAGEACPYFSGNPIKAHWGISDPATFKGSKDKIEAEFQRVFLILKKRVEAFCKLPVVEMSKENLQETLNKIGLI